MKMSHGYESSESTHTKLNMGGAARDKGEIVRFMDDLVSSLDTLEQEISALEVILAPALTIPDTKAPPPPAIATSPAVSPLGSNIRDQKDRVQFLVRKVLTLRNEVQL